MIFTQVCPAPVALERKRRVSYGGYTPQTAKSPNSPGALCAPHPGPCSLIWFAGNSERRPGINSHAEVRLPWTRVSFCETRAACLPSLFSAVSPCRVALLLVPWHSKPRACSWYGGAAIIHVILKLLSAIAWLLELCSCNNNLLVDSLRCRCWYSQVMDPGSSDGGLPRFSPVSFNDHAGDLWIVAILSLTYSVMVVLARAYIKYKMFGFDDIMIAAATVNHPLRTQLNIATNRMAAFFLGITPGTDYCSFCRSRKWPRQVQLHYRARAMGYFFQGKLPNQWLQPVYLFQYFA